VIKESLRLYPPAWLIIRQTLEAFPLEPYHVPRGAQIWICPYTMHRHPGFYGEPEAFRPERFLPDEHGRDLEARLPKFAYLPFGGGPRICIGNMFALMEAQLFLATIAQRYRLVLDADRQPRVRAAATLGFEEGAPMRVVEPGEQETG
jgi:cytochrome P450